jgi:type VI secretion system protein ImpI/type VI secretion system protein
VLTLRFQSTGPMPGAAEPVAMRGANLTIGRGEENDLVLPDPDRTISKRHCVLERHGPDVVVIDLSTNGTFLNYAKTPVGKTPAPLSPGDVLSLGAYELVVEITDEVAPPLEPARRDGREAPMSPAADWSDPVEAPGDDLDFLDELLGPAAAPEGPRRFIPEDPLDPLGGDADPIFGAPRRGRPEEAVASRSEHRPPTQDHFTPPAGRGAYLPEDWDEVEDTFGATPRPAPETPAARPGDPQDAPAAVEPAAEPARAAEPGGAPAAGPRADAARDAAVAGFLAAAGLDEDSIPEAERAEVMANLGAVLRTLVEGVREVLTTRTAIKSEFRMEQTTVRAGNNNPLKFAVTPEQAMAALARPTRGYLAPPAAAAEALRDIRAHEVAMVTGMEAALKGLLGRLDPKTLAGAIEGGGGLAGLFKGRKERYWEAYEAMYADIADKAENDFHEVFGREFARAYQAQVRKL